MERKRGVDGDGSSSLPPSKQIRQSVAQSSPSALDIRTNAVPSAIEEEQDDATPVEVQQLQRAQLGSLVEHQRTQLKWLSDEVAKLQHLLSVLDAAPRAALYHMAAVREDLTLTLAQLGLSGDLVPEDCPIAATLLDEEAITNNALSEVPEALKSLTAQIILALQMKHKTLDTEALAARATAADLHKRYRTVSDQLERYAEREKKFVVTSTGLSDELDDVRLECRMRRSRITNLEQALRTKEESNVVHQNGLTDESGVAGADGSMITPDKGSPNRSGAYSQTARKFSGSNGVNGNADLIEAEKSARELSQKRLEELEQLHEQVKQGSAQIEALRLEIAKRDGDVIPHSLVLKSSLYQIMESTLQQLYLKERKWQDERNALNEERVEDMKLAEERLSEAKQTADRTIEDYKRQVSDLQKIADAAKAEKDKAILSYEARKMESGTVASVMSVTDKKVAICEEMRNKLTESNKALNAEIDICRKRLADCERLLAENATGKEAETIQILRRELDEERKKSAMFICEVESLSNMFAELESENSRIVKQLAEKEQVLSRIMGERLRARQLLTTVKEENKALNQGRTIDNDRIKALTAQLAVCKKHVSDAFAARNAAVEESRKQAAQSERRRRIADDATLTARTAIAEKEEMKKERDAYMARAESKAVGVEDNRFAVQRLTEENAMLKKQLEIQDAAIKANGKSNSNGDVIRDEIISELTKKLNCSVLPSQRKNVVLTRCGHLFSKQCTDDLITTRNRKCPMCGRMFGLDDILPVYF